MILKYKLINSVYVHVWVQLLLSQNILGIVKARVYRLYIHVCLCVITCRGTVTAYVEKACFTK